MTRWNPAGLIVVLALMGGPTLAASDRPLVRMPALEQGSEVRGDVLIDIVMKPADDGTPLRKLDVSIDGQAIVTFDLEPEMRNVTFNWMTADPRWTDGRHELVARLQDARGRQAEYRTFVYVWNRGKPSTGGRTSEIEIQETDGQNDLVLTQKALIRVKVDPRLGAKWVILYLNDKMIAMMNYPPYQEVLDPARKKLEDGPYIVKARVIHPDNSESFPEPVQISVNLSGNYTPLRPMGPGTVVPGATAVPAPAATAARVPNIADSPGVAATTEAALPGGPMPALTAERPAGEAIFRPEVNDGGRVELGPVPGQAAAGAILNTRGAVPNAPATQLPEVGKTAAFDRRLLGPPVPARTGQGTVSSGSPLAGVTGVPDLAGGSAETRVATPLATRRLAAPRSGPGLVAEASAGVAAPALGTAGESAATRVATPLAGSRRLPARASVGLGSAGEALAALAELATAAGQAAHPAVAFPATRVAAARLSTGRQPLGEGGQAVTGELAATAAEARVAVSAPGTGRRLSAPRAGSEAILAAPGTAGAVAEPTAATGSQVAVQPPAAGRRTGIPATGTGQVAATEAGAVNVPASAGGGQIPAGARAATPAPAERVARPAAQTASGRPRTTGGQPDPSTVVVVPGAVRQPSEARTALPSGERRVPAPDSVPAAAPRVVEVRPGATATAEAAATSRVATPAVVEPVGVPAMTVQPGQPATLTGKPGTVPIPPAGRPQARPQMPAVAASAPRVIGRVYTVKKGDTLYSLANRHGIAVERLAKVNRITDVALIRIGQKLVVPSGDLFVDGRQVACDVAPIQSKDGLTTSPFRFVVEAMGGSVTWVGPDKEVQATTKNRGVITITVGSPEATVNDEKVLMDLAAYLEQDRTMVPTRFISQALDVTIDLDPQSGNIRIRSNR